MVRIVLMIPLDLLELYLDVDDLIVNAFNQVAMGCGSVVRDFVNDNTRTIITYLTRSATRSRATRGAAVAPPVITITAP